MVNRMEASRASPAAMQKAMLSRIRLPVTAAVSNTWLRGSEAGAMVVKLRPQLEYTVFPRSARSAAPCVRQITGLAGYAKHSPLKSNAHQPPALRRVRILVLRRRAAKKAESTCASMAHTPCSSQHAWQPLLHRISSLYKPETDSKNESQYRHRSA